MLLVQIENLVINLENAVSFRLCGDGRVNVEFANGNDYEVFGDDAARLWEWLEYQSKVRKWPLPGTPEAKALRERLILSRGSQAGKEASCRAR